MPTSDIEVLRTEIKNRWPGDPSTKASRYVGAFFSATQKERRISAQVEGNHGTYTVLIQVDEQGLSSACSCYIGKGGYCHHCAALAFTFLQDESSFEEIVATTIEDVRCLVSLRAFLRGVTLESLLKQLSECGVTQKALAESMDMNPRHLTAIKSSELRNRHFNELSATKLACLWVIDHLNDIKTKQS